MDSDFKKYLSIFYFNNSLSKKSTWFIFNSFKKLNLSMEKHDLEDGFFWLNIVQYGLAGFLHCTGLVVLWKFPKQTNQNVILFYLSLTEVNIVFTGITLGIHVVRFSYLTQLPETILFIIIHSKPFRDIRD